MRDPARIDQILELIKNIWIANSDFRLGQLLDGVYGDQPLCSVEDTVIKQRLQEWWDKFSAVERANINLAKIFRERCKLPSRNSYLTFFLAPTLIRQIG